MRVVIAEDSALLADGLTRVLQAHAIDVVATVGTADDLLTAVRETSPDLAVIDVRMPPTFTDEGIRAALRLSRETPDTALLLLSQIVEDRYAAELLAQRQHSVGYLLKDRVADLDEFIATVRQVAGGGTALDPEVVSQLLVRRRDPLTALSTREREVLALMAEGRSNAAIASALFISESAVAKHIASIFTKLDIAADASVNRRVAAVLRLLK